MGITRIRSHSKQLEGDKNKRRKTPDGPNISKKSLQEGGDVTAARDQGEGSLYHLSGSTQNDKTEEAHTHTREMRPGLMRATKKRQLRGQPGRTESLILLLPALGFLVPWASNFIALVPLSGWK